MTLISSLLFAAMLMGITWLCLNKFEQQRLEKIRTDTIDHKKQEIDIEKNAKNKTSSAYLKRQMRAKKQKEFLTLIAVLVLAFLAALLWQTAANGPLGWKFVFTLLLTLVIRRFLRVRTLRKRKKQIEEDLPAILDLLLVCIEAGMSMTAAIIRVSNEMPKSPLSEELKQTFHELNLGLPTQEAFLNLGNRTQVQDLQSLATAIVQSDDLGISLGETLRSQARILRESIRLRTRERILKMPIKLIFPLVLFIMPAIFTIVAGPSFIQIMDGVILKAIVTAASAGK